MSAAAITTVAIIAPTSCDDAETTMSVCMAPPLYVIDAWIDGSHAFARRLPSAS